MILTAYKFMKFDKTKSLGVIVGIVISIFLIGNQAGILGFLTSLMGGLVGNSRQDIGQIWVVDNITRNANELARLDESLVRKIRSIEGVSNTYPVVVAPASIKFPNGKNAPIVMIGSEAPAFVAGPLPETIEQGEILSLADDMAVSVEFFDQAQFDYPVEKGQRVEINGKSAIVKVQTRNARGFAGSFVYSTIEKVRYYTSFPVSKVSAVAVSLRPEYDPDEIVSKINSTFYGIKAWKAKDLERSTINYITLSSNIGTSIGSLVVFAIISGFFIIGLTLYSSAVDRIKDYGTLKAIGASDWYITLLILTQSFLFAITGFITALILLEGFRAGVRNAGLIIQYSFTEYLILFLITVLISVGSAIFFSIRTIRNVEPASVFRG